MLIMSRNRDALVNLERANGIYIDPWDDDAERKTSEIYAAFGVTYPEDICTLGVYETERAKEILKDIADRQGISTYYMPEEWYNWLNSCCV